MLQNFLGKEIVYNGAPILTEEEKSKLFQLREVLPSASASVPIWITKDENSWRKFPISDQAKTNQCVAFTITKLMGIENFLNEGEFIDLSKSYLYEQRNNKPSAGMNAQDAFNLAEKGVPLEVLYPSKKVNNDTTSLTAKDYVKRVAEAFKAGKGLALPVGDIDAIASTIQATGKGVMIWVWGEYKEWAVTYPEVKNTEINMYNATIRHSISAVDFFIYKGKKCLLIEDSWGIDTGLKGRRIVSEDFITDRNYFAGYLTSFKYTEKENVAKPLISIKLQYGDERQEVELLQKYLQAKGFFPSNHKTTTYYGNITADAVLKWQLANKIDTPEKLKEWNGHYFGTRSIEALK